MKKILFIGHFEEVLSTIINFVPKFTIEVLVESKPINQNVIDLCKVHGLKFFEVSNSNELKNFSLSISASQYDFAIMASFGLILKEDFISKFKQIVNIHPGILETQRGRHPLPNAILNKEQKMGLTAHLVTNSRIDYGDKVIELILPIIYNKNYKTNEKYLRQGLKPITQILLKYIIEFGEIPSYNWNNDKSPYNKRLEEKQLNMVLNSIKLKDII